MFSTLKDFTKIYLKKSNGTTRVIYSPNPELKKRLRNFLNNVIYKELHVSKFSHGFVLGRNIVTNALPHVGKKWILKVDIKDCFHRLRWDVFLKYYNQRIKDSVYQHKLVVSNSDEYKFCFLSIPNKLPFTPQGSPCSPALVNFVLTYFDMRVVRSLKKYVDDGINIDYTRYADDITISCDDKEYLHRAFSICKKFIKGFDMEFNKKKIKFIPNWNRQKVCGIIVNEKINIPRKERKRIRAIKHQLKLGLIKPTPEIIGLLNFYDMVKKFDNQNNKLTIKEYFVRKGIEALISNKKGIHI